MPHLLGMGIIDNLEKLLHEGQDSSTLRFGLGNAYFQQHDYQAALSHLKQAVAMNPEFSAAWKLLAKALSELDEKEQAVAAYERGIRCATEQGDIQAAKEMKVFLKRLQKS